MAMSGYRILLLSKQRIDPYKPSVLFLSRHTVQTQIRRPYRLTSHDISIFLHTGKGYLRFYPGIENLILPVLSYPRHQVKSSSEIASERILGLLEAYFKINRYYSCEGRIENPSLGITVCHHSASLRYSFPVCKKDEPAYVQTHKSLCCSHMNHSTKVKEFELLFCKK